MIREQGRWIGKRLSSWARSATRMVVEMSCGAAVGGLVAWYAVSPAEETVAIGALLGAALGFVVGGPKRHSTREENGVEQAPVKGLDAA